MNQNTLDILIKKAKEASQYAYAPYSKFKVGSALLTESGEIFVGCNVENQSYGLTNCAERTAIFKAISEGYNTINTIIIYAATQTPTAPCGACRQVIAEFGQTAKVVCVCESDERIETTIDKLFPHSIIPLNESEQK